VHRETSPEANYFYRAYGLTLASDTALSALRDERQQLGPPDVLMSLGREPDWVREARHLPFQIGRPRAGEVEGDGSPFTLTTIARGEFFQLAYDDGTRFFVDGTATRLWGTWLPPLTIEDVSTYLLGPVLGFVVRRRGILALHASCVCLSGNALLLCGSSAAGKSTTAAALALRGLSMLTDDIAPVMEDQGSLYVEPGYPRACLWPEAVEILFGAPGALPRITPSWEKCFLALDGVGKFTSQKRPLKAIYLLAPRVDEANAPRIEEPGMREALVELVQNTYMNWLLDRNQRALELDALTRLVAKVPVRRIVPHADGSRIGALCELIIEEAQRESGRQYSAAAECER
jgi:hypothetical protein